MNSRKTIRYTMEDVAPAVAMLQKGVSATRSMVFRRSVSGSRSEALERIGCITIESPFIIVFAQERKLPALPSGLAQLAQAVGQHRARLRIGRTAPQAAQTADLDVQQPRRLAIPG